MRWEFRKNLRSRGCHIADYFYAAHAVCPPFSSHLAPVASRATFAWATIRTAMASDTQAGGYWQKKTHQQSTKTALNIGHYLED
jgi:hypothetical protein